MSWRIKGSGTGEPSLDLRFASTKSLNDYVSGNNLTTFTRSSTGTYFDANGVLQSAPAGVARFDHNPETGESLGLLMEEARTNLLLNSATLSTQSATVTATSTTLSFYGTGTVTLTGVSTAGPLVGTGASNRVSLTFTPTAGSLTLTVSGSVTNAQLEAGSYPTSYIPTTGSTVTRAADVCTVTNSNIYDTDSFTIINQPFGASAGASTLTLFDGPEPIKRATVYSADLSQATINAAAGKTDEFWRWRVLGSSFALPNFLTDGQVTVDWGDGTIETLTTATHTFSNGSGYHDIGFRLDSGTYFRPRINNNASHDTKVVALGPAPESMKLRGDLAFFGCSNLEAFDATVDATGGTSFEQAWQNCTSLTSFPLINTSAGTSFEQAWQNCTSLTSFPLLNTSAGTNFNTAWNGCTSLTSFPLINTSAGTNFNSAWRNCTSLTSFPLIDTAAGTNFNSAWNGCTSLTSFPLIDTSSGTNFRDAWRNCSSLTSFPSIDTSSGTDFRSAWNGCNSLTSFPLINTSSGTAFRKVLGLAVLVLPVSRYLILPPGQISIQLGAGAAV
jgi:hypothetical protein